MLCSGCGRVSPDTAAFCAACGTVLRPALAVTPTMRLRAGSLTVAEGADAEATVIGRPAPELGNDAGATVVAPDPGADATILGQAADATMLGRGPDATMLGPGADAAMLDTDLGATMPGPRPGGWAPSRPSSDATVLASGTDAATVLSVRPPLGAPTDFDVTVAGSTDAGATVLTPGPPRKALTTTRGRRVRKADDDADTGPFDIGQQFGRYTIIRLLGIGGMGAVYQAWDEELEVAVALKVIRPEAIADPRDAQDLERRFKRELLLARQVTHKNVVRIHDLGEMEGIKYITMSYIHGPDLASMLASEGRLPVPKALAVIRGVVSGLVAAHQAGVVHRDLKPANIMVEAATNDPVIMDFGIARSAGGQTDQKQAGVPAEMAFRAPSALSNATMAGSIVGTVAYMAPEQARGKEVDQRADIYALGLIFYDLLMGPRRFEGVEHPVAELKARMEQPPPSPRSLDPEIPEAIDALIMRCLEPDPVARYETTAELATALDRLDDHGVPLPAIRRLTSGVAATAGVVMLGLVGLTYWAVKPEPVAPTPDPLSVLVANFDNKTSEPVFSGAVEKALGIGLEGASFITAYPREDALRLANRIKPGSTLDEQTSRLISVREGVRVVVTGTVEKEGQGYAITVKAVDPAVDKVLATTAATASSRDGVLSAVGSLAANLRAELGDTTPESARLAGAETFTAASLEAMEAYARGQDLARLTKNQEALAAYEQAIKFDPNFGRAYAGMAVTYSNLKDEARAKSAYEQALKQVDRMSEREKYRTLGGYYLQVARNYEKAIENYETLVKLYPADRAGRGNLAFAYLNLGNVKGAAEQVRALLEIYPKNTLQRYNYAMYSMYAGDFDTATAEAERVLKENPAFDFPYIPLALSALARGNIEGARATYERLAKSSESGASIAALGIADLEMTRGRPKAALAVLQPAMAIDQKAENAAGLARKQVVAAEAYLALGQRARAVAAARAAAGLSEHEGVLFPAALVFLQAGQQEQAEQIAVRLENMLQTHTTAYARLIDAEIAVRRGRFGLAIEAYRDSLKRRDTWFGRFLLGRTYAQLDRHPEALAELDLSIKRRGEATDVFFDDTPTERYLPPAYYWLARTQQALGVADAPKTFEQFLALRVDADPADTLAVDAARRVGTPR